MKGRKVSAISIIGIMLAFIGALGLSTPACIGWFYKPNLPLALTKNIEEK